MGRGSANIIFATANQNTPPLSPMGRFWISVATGSVKTLGNSAPGITSALFKNAPIRLDSLETPQISDAEEKESNLGNRPRITAPGFHEPSTLAGNADNNLSTNFMGSGDGMPRPNE